MAAKCTAWKKDSFAFPGMPSVVRWSRGCVNPTSRRAAICTIAPKGKKGFTASVDEGKHANKEFSLDNSTLAAAKKMCDSLTSEALNTAVPKK
jgi:hypothetical protein